MINRTMVRTKVLQALYAYYQDQEKTPLTARKELRNSYADTYALYCMLLDFPNELVRHAASLQDDAIARARITHTTYTANHRFIDNQLIDQLFTNRRLRHELEEQHLGWDTGHSAVSAIYKQFSESDVFKEYMALEHTTYEDDKRIIRKLYADFLPSNEALESALEEMELTLDRQNWVTDLNVVLSYVIKTIKRFNEETTPDEPLLEMFDNEDELNFGQELLRYAIERKDEYETLINAHLKNWDADRIAFMDRVILLTALAEMLNFQSIAIEVSINEYLELAKEYSGDKSHLFINGVLDEIVKDLKRQNKLFK